MNLQYLEEFIHVAHTLNFTQTANELHLTQPTLSKHIAMLEDDLGAELLERKPYGVRLTEVGLYFLGHATSIVDEYAEAKENIRKSLLQRPVVVDGRLDDHFIVGAISVAASIMEDNGHEKPIIFNHNHDDTPINLLINGEIDAIIDNAHVISDDAKNLVFEPTLSRPIVAVMEVTNPLATRDELHMEDLRDQTLVHIIGDKYQTGWASVQGICEAHGFEPHTRSVAVGSYAECVFSIPSGCVLIFPRSFGELKYLNQTHKWKAIPIVDEDAVFNAYLTYRKDNADKLAEFIAALHEATQRLSDN
jgi:DNA-binding transcriptional LysR family regulator